jgi:hypothetical protein
MASPFATFRKNSRFWMAALVLLAILAFVVAPAIETATRSFRGGDEEAKAIFVTWDGGRMTRGEVEQGMAKRNQLLLFLRALSKRVIENGGEPAVPGFSRWQTGEIRSLGIDEEVSAQRICLGRIVATHAHRLGVQFDDNAADEFLKNFCNDRIADDEFYEILKSSTAGLTIYDLREMLKQELAVIVAQGLAGGVGTTRPPSKTWRDFLKLNQTAKIEAFPVFVSEYMSKVTGMPSEGEIQEIYDEGKNLLPNPNSEVAGFMRPYLANVEYVESRFQTWIDREKEKLTEEEIREEYDRLVTLGQLKVPEEEESPADQEKSPEEERESDEMSDSSEGTAPSEGEQSGEEEMPAQDAGNSPSDTVSDPALEEPQPSAESSPQPESPQPDGADQADPELANPDSLSSTGLPFRAGIQTGRLVSVNQEASLGEEVGSSLASEAITEESSGEPASDAMPEVADSAQESQAVDAANGQTATQEPPKMRNQTFDEARDEVALQLARSRAVAVADDALTEIMQKMREYYLAYRQYQAYRNAGMDDAELPTRPDLKQMAAKYGLTYSETGMSDSLRLSSSNFGNSSVFSDNRRVGSVAEVATAPQIELFTPMQSGYAGPDPTEFYQYLFWKTDARPSTTPDLNEVRDEVIEAWKRKQARILAEEEALRLAAKVGGDEDPWGMALSETLRTLVVNVDPFTWLSRMGMRVIPTMVTRLDGVGQEFMKRVFSADPGSTITAPNQAQSVYYVVRVIEKAPDVEELQERFDADQFKQGPSAVADLELSDEANVWLSRVFSDLNVQFQ